MTRVIPPDGTDPENPIIHDPGCGWETGPYCTCGKDPERMRSAEKDALIELMIGVYYGGAAIPSSHNLGVFGELADAILAAGYRRPIPPGKYDEWEPWEDATWD